MAKLFDLALYNPARLSDEDFLSGFVAREALAELILDRLRDIRKDGLAQHRLIVGQRGMGKTSLLRRLALEVRRDPQLASVLIPLSFREEQYNVHSMFALGCNCLDALGDFFEATGQQQKTRELDRELAALGRAGDTDGSQAFDLFRSWLKREGRRPLLLVDNLDIVLAGVAKDHWSLRRLLQQAGGIVMIGASAHGLEAAIHPAGAFYDFFQVDLLERLDLGEVKACLRRLSSLRGEAGQRVRQLLASDPARIEVLHDLTGGNPRTLAMLYLVLEAADDDLMRDLERLLDQATPLYKARVEELAPQARVVFDALALHWDPVTAADLAALTSLDTSAVSTQLDRLVKDGIAEKTSLSKTRRAGFQVAERFFNIWYLMRHGPRRQRQQLKWLVETLRCLYSPAELEGHARAILGGREGAISGSYCLAVSDALADGPLKDWLARRALRDDPRLADEPSAGQLSEAETLYRRARGIATGGAPALSPAAEAEAEAALRRSVEVDPTFLPGFFDLGLALLARCALGEAENVFRRAIGLDPSFLPARENLGKLLKIQGRLEEAEALYRGILEIDPENVNAWQNLGALLGSAGRFAESEAAWQRAATLDRGSTLSWQILAHLRRDDGRYQEAEAILETALGHDGSSAETWSALGNLLADQLGRLPEAERALRRAVELAPAAPVPRANLAYLLISEGRMAEAEEPCRAALGGLPAHGAFLLRAFRRLGEGDLGGALGELGAALATEHAELLTIYRDDLLRCLRFAASRGWGDLILAWVAASPFGDRYRAIWLAYEAHLHGAERLRDANPEIRAGARRLLNELAGVRPAAGGGRRATP